jgi:hypothetical protein
MHLFFYCTSLVLAQAPSELHFLSVSQGKIEVVAPLSAAQKQAISAGILTAEQGEAWLRFSVLNADNKPGPPMLGSYVRDDAHLVFRPRLGVEPGRKYRAFFGPAEGPVITKDYQAPLRNGGAPATVVKIYPTANELPANQLRFYIYFSQPMRGGKVIFDQIQILDADGNVLPDVWLVDELWDETGQVLIIYIHPGRIKWGLVLRDVLGPVLMPERSYSLAIRGSMLDANGRELGKDVIKKFRTMAEDRVRINLGDWKVDPPRARTSEPLTVLFSKSLDHKSLQQFLTVTNAKGATVAGSISIGKDEKSWAFVPTRPWEQGEHRLAVGGRLEDVAGNTPLRPFDLDLQAPQPAAQPLTLPFRPR